MIEQTSSRRRGRKLAGMLAGGLALSVLPFAVPASAQTTDLPEARDIREFACPVDDGADNELGTADDTTVVPEDGFTDVPASNIHEFSIDCVAWYQITSGATATTYNPARPVQRDQMATFIAQLIDYVADRTAADDGLDPAPAGNLFPCDLTTANVHFENIQRLAAANVVVGTGTDDGEACFNPGGSITRAQMASFIRQAQDVVGTAVPDTTTNVDYFVDDNGDTHEDNINAIAAEGIVRGTGDNANNEPNYSPGRNVPRDQMATFLANKLDRLIEDTEATPPPFATLSAVTTTVAAGGSIMGTVTAGNGGTIDSLTISGCGTTETDVDVANTATANFSVMVPTTQTTGNCTLTVETTFTDEAAGIFGGQDRTETDTATVTITAAATS